jgi:hypothetical protein
MGYSPPQARSWYDHPAINVAGLAIGVVALALGIYFYFASLTFRQLDYYVSPDRAIVVKSGFSDLHILYKNQEIKEDVTAAQVTIWNAGNEPIRMENVLTPVEIVTEPKVKILSASVRRVNRNVIAFQTDQKLLSTGVVPLSWKILEHGDAAIVQVIYLGDPHVRVKLTGIVEGQSPIRGIELGGTIKSPSEQLKADRHLAYLALAASILGLLPAGLARWRISSPSLSSDDPEMYRAINWIFICTVTVVALAVAFVIYRILGQPSLPFS